MSAAVDTAHPQFVAIAAAFFAEERKDPDNTVPSEEEVADTPVAAYLLYIASK